MKLIRTVAFITAIIMCLVPFGVVALGDPGEGSGSPLSASSKSKGRLVSKGHEDYFNAPGGYFSFTEVDEAYPMADMQEGNVLFVQSGNAGVQSSVSGLRTAPVVCRAGETVSFRYQYDTEETYDFFEFAVNSQNLLSLSGSSGDWQDYTYTIPEDGEYVFEWKYVKDVRTDAGADCIRLSGLRYSAMQGAYLERAAVRPGSGSASVSVSTSGDASYGVKRSTSEAHPLYTYSGNFGTASSVSTLSAEVFLREGWELGFDYAYQLEDGHDFFVFGYELGGEEIEVERLSGSDDYNWHRYTFTAPAEGLYTFSWTCEKDEAGDVGQDVVCIDNISVCGELFESSEALLADAASEVFFLNTAPGSRAFRDTGRVSPNGGKILASSARYTDAGFSVLKTIINMDEGETFSFTYSVSSEAGHDTLRYLVNGTEFVNASGENGGWKSFTFTAEERGSYFMTWIYAKDGEGSRGRDCAYITDMVYNGTYHQSLELSDHVNAPDGEIAVFTTSDYGFMPVFALDRACAISRSSYYRGLEAKAFSDTVKVMPGQSVFFKYFVDSGETGNTLVFRILDEDGELLTEAEFGSGSWDSFVFDFTEEMNVSFEWIYSTGDTVDLDCYDFAAIMGLELIGEPIEPTPGPTGEPTPEPTPGPTGEPTPEPTPGPTGEPTPEPTPGPTGEPTPEPTPGPTGEPTPGPTGEPTPEPTDIPVIPPELGDVNGDSEVNVTDALLVLRLSMGIIDSIEHPEAADVNSDGEINMTDALLILRLAMGIIQQF